LDEATKQGTDQRATSLVVLALDRSFLNQP
jgi:hypothetical protein